MYAYNIFTNLHYHNVSTSHLKTVYNFAYRIKSFLSSQILLPAGILFNSVCTVGFSKLTVQSYYNTAL
jgi:hypothetical protein